MNPILLCQLVEKVMSPDSVIIVDGGDFVGTAAYIVRPRGPLCWLDPGVFGTLGVGGGFILGAKAARPKSEIWCLFGDGALGFSIAEFDTMARHRIGCIAVVGNDGCWSQIEREQVKIYNDDIACALARSNYHTAVEGLGGRGFLITKPEEILPALESAQRLAAEGIPCLVNVFIAKSNFREGSISL